MRAFHLRFRPKLRSVSKSKIPQGKVDFGVDRTKLEYAVAVIGSNLSSASFFLFFYVILQGLWTSQPGLSPGTEGFFSCNQKLFLINYLHRRNVLCVQRNLGQANPSLNRGRVCFPLGRQDEEKSE